MRALLDTNILISYLLTPARNSPVTKIVTQGLLGDFVLLVPEELLQELKRKAHEKEYLAERIAPEELEKFVDTLTGVSESITVHAAAGTGSASLEGSYYALSPISWVIETQGDVLKIYIPYPRFGVFFNNLSMTLSIPQAYAGSIKIRSVSGAITLPDTQPIEWSSLDVGTVSGRITVEKASFAEIKASSVSGEIVLSQIEGTVDSKTTSGAISLDYLGFQSSSARSVSGSVKITLPKDSDLAVSYTTVSGSFVNQGLSITIETQTSRKFSGKIGNGSQSLTVSTTSGRFTITGR